MKRDDVIKLYEKERDYQKNIFGEYINNPALNSGSFLLLIENCLNKAKKYYASKWTSELPEWLINTREFQTQKTSPVDSYEELIKIMALAGAVLETYTFIDVEKWREEGINPKWKE